MTLGSEAPNASDELVLVTYEFPFGKRETFLEAEICVLSRYFSKVWIIPSRRSWVSPSRNPFDGMIRSLPENCFTVLLERDIPRAIRFGLINTRQLLRAIRLEPGERWISQLRTALREIVKVHLFASGLHSWISVSRKRSLVYSYWKTEGATALALLKQCGDIDYFVSRCHRGDLYYEHEATGRVFRPFDKFVFDQCLAVAPVSQHGCEYLAQRGFDPQKIRLARLGVRRVTSPSRYSADGVLRIASCSNLIRVKRVDLLARALARLKTPFEWIHFGCGPEKALVIEEINNFPEFGSAKLCGQVTNLKILDYYQSNPVDVFVNVSSSEGVPVSIMEALSCGIPCIVTDVGGSSEIVDDSCGRVVRPNVTIEELAQWIESVASDHEAWILRRVDARRRAMAVCDADVNYSQFCSLLRPRTITDNADSGQV